MSTKTIALNGTPLLRENVDGISRYSLNVLEALARRHPQWQFLILGFRDECNSPQKLPNYPNVQVAHLPFSRRAYKLISVGRLVDVGRFVLAPIDILLSTDFVLMPYVKASKKVVVIHDLAFRDLPGTVASRNRRFLNRGVPQSLTRADAIACVSQFTQKRLENYYVEKIFGKLTLLAQNGVDSRFFEEVSSGQVRELRERYNLPERFLLSVGTIEPRKNLAYLIDAFSRLSSGQQKNCPLVLIGKSGWGKQVSSDSPYILFTGYVDDDDLPALYHLADAFVFPSLYEGFGIPVLEAMAAGVTVISTRIPSVEEFAADAIIYAPIDDPDRFAQLLLMRSDSEQLEKGKQIASRYSWDNVIAELDKWITRQVTCPNE